MMPTDGDGSTTVLLRLIIRLVTFIVNIVDDDDAQVVRVALDVDPAVDGTERQKIGAPQLLRNLDAAFVVAVVVFAVGGGGAVVVGGGDVVVDIVVVVDAV